MADELKQYGENYKYTLIPGIVVLHCPGSLNPSRPTVYDGTDIQAALDLGVLEKWMNPENLRWEYYATR
jgi:hypothetical protein